MIDPYGSRKVIGIESKKCDPIVSVENILFPVEKKDKLPSGGENRSGWVVRLGFRLFEKLWRPGRKFWDILGLPEISGPILTSGLTLPYRAKKSNPFRQRQSWPKFNHKLAKLLSRGHQQIQPIQKRLTKVHFAIHCFLGDVTDIFSKPSGKFVSGFFLKILNFCNYIPFLSYTFMRVESMSKHTAEFWLCKFRQIAFARVSSIIFCWIARQFSKFYNIQFNKYNILQLVYTIYIVSIQYTTYIFLILTFYIRFCFFFVLFWFSFFLGIFWHQRCIWDKTNFKC